MRFLLCTLMLAFAGLASAQTFHPLQTLNLGADADAVAVGDLDGDGQPEALVFTGYSQTASAAGALHVLSADPVTGVLAVRASRDLTPIHVTRTAIVVARRPAGNVAVGGNYNQLHVATFDGTSIASTTMITTLPNDFLLAVDLDGDGTDEIFSHSWDDGGAVYGFDANGALALRYLVPTEAAGWNDLAAGDLTGDGLVDVAVMSGQYYLSPNLTVFPGDGAGGLGAGQTYRVAQNENTRGIAVGDINTDGRADVVLSRGRNSPTWVWTYQQTDDGQLAGLQTTTAYQIPSDMVIVDIDRDGINELLVLHDGWGRLSVFSTDAGGLTPTYELVQLGFGYYDAHAVAAGDVSGDGCPDVLVAAGNGGLQFLRNIECLPPTNDLAAGVTIARATAAVTATSLSGNGPAEDVSAVVQFKWTSGLLSIIPPAGCSPGVTRAIFHCHRAGSLAVGDEATWKFTLRASRHTYLKVGATVSSATLDPDPSNNAATVEQRL